MRILGLSGSLRRGSHNTALLRAAAATLPPGAELEHFHGLKELPPFDADDEHAPGPAVEALREAIARADAVLIATPEYNRSIPGVLKNALDWASRPAGESVLRNKPAAVIGASTGVFGAVWAQAEVRKVLASIGARVLDAELPVALAHERLRPDTWDGLREILRDLLDLGAERELRPGLTGDRSPGVFLGYSETARADRARRGRMRFSSAVGVDGAASPKS